MFYVLMFEFMLLGVIGGLLGIFYRNCLKVKDMIFYPLYSKVFVPMVKSGNRFLHFIAYPLGFCIYCSTFWITMLILILFLTSWDSLPKWQDLKGQKFDRIIIFSDSQDCDYPKKRIPKPFGKHNYIVDVSANTRGVNYKGVWDAEISGWSEHFLTYIAALEGLQNIFEEQ